jgi:hypothetical protein
MSDRASMTFNTARFRLALESFAKFSRKDSEVILRDAARNFVRRAIALTPPSQGKADTAAKKRGEAAVKSDLRKIFDPLDPAEWAAFLDDVGGLRIVPTHRANRRGAAVTDYTLFLGRQQMEMFHNSMRRPSNGRVRSIDRNNLIGRKKSDVSAIGFVKKTDYAWFERRVIGRVGILAGGFNRAAAGLGYNPPAWIRRHGNSRGQFEVLFSGGVLRIVIGNDVKFAGGVRGLQRKLQTALDQQAIAMERKVEYFLAKQAAKAGL